MWIVSGPMWKLDQLRSGLGMLRRTPDIMCLPGMSWPGGLGFRSAVTELQGVDRNTRGQARMLRRVARHPLQFGSGMGVPLTRGGEGESGAISRRGRAASLFPAGAAGIGVSHQGEELGLHEVAEIPADQRQDPTFFRTH